MSTIIMARTIKSRRSMQGLELDLLDRATESLRSSPPAKPAAGWIRSIRQALGMSRAQLAGRLGVTPATVADLERSEARGTISLNTLQKVASGLGLQLHYGLTPIKGKSFEVLIIEQAQKIARERIRRVSHTMALEDQAIDEKTRESQLKRAVERLLAGSRRALWR